MADLDFSKAVRLKPEELNFGKAEPLQQQGAKPEEPGFLKSAWDTAQGPMDILRGIGGAVQHPIDTLRNMGQQNADLMGKTAQNFREGRPIAGIRSAVNTGINAAVPGLGASSEDAGDDLEAGRYRQGLGKTAGVGVNAAEAALAPRGIPRAAEGAAEGVSNIPRAAKAVGAGLKAGGPDMARGAAMVAGGEGLSHVIPGSPLLLHMALDYPGVKTALQGVRSGATAGMENWRASLGDLVKPAEEPVTPFEPYQARKLPNMPKYGGPAEPSASGGGSRPIAPAVRPSQRALAPSTAEAPQSEPFEPFKAKTLKNMPKYGGPAEPTYGQGGSSSGASAPRPMPGAPGVKRMEMQHLGDLRLPRNQPAPPPMYNAQGQPIDPTTGLRIFKK